MRGALLVSAAYAGRPEWAGQVAGRTGGTVNVTVSAEVTAAAQVLSPWPAASPSQVAVCVQQQEGSANASVDQGASVASSCPPQTQPVAVAWSELPGPFGGPLVAWNATAGLTYVLLLS